MDPVSSANNLNSQRLTSAASESVLGKEDFLTLLVAQLENQDPLNPTEGTEFVAQLAQFSSLEQLITMNQNFEMLKSYQSTVNNSLATSYMGKSIVATGNAVSLEGGIASDITFTLPDAASEIMVNIYDANGKFLTSIEPGPLGAGEQTLSWNGSDAAGNLMDDGVYMVEIQAENGDGQSIQATSYVEGKVTGVRHMNGQAYLMLGDTLVPLAAVTEVTGGAEEELTPEAVQELAQNIQVSEGVDSVVDGLLDEL